MKYFNFFVVVFTLVVAIHNGIQGKIDYALINASICLINLGCFVYLDNKDVENETL